MLEEKGHIRLITWDLSDLYNDIDDPKINKDIEKAINISTVISTRYKSKIAKLKAKDIKEAIEYIEETTNIVTKLSAFAYLKLVTNISNHRYNNFAQKIQEITNQIAKKIIFFELEWINLSDNYVKDILNSNYLTKYKFYLKNIRKYKQHLLSYDQEQLLIEISPVGKNSWLKLFDKIHTKQRYGVNKLNQEEIIAQLYSSNRKIRKKAAKELTKGLKQNIDIFTHIFNTILTDKMIDDNIRGYNSWISATNLQNNIDDTTVTILIDSVTNNYHLVKEYYKIKKRLLGLKKLFDYDRYAPLPLVIDKDISWSQAKKIILETLYEFNYTFGEIAKKFFDNNWIDASVRKDKIAGAFSYPTIPSIHPYILVNFTGNLHDVETLAHELGHGIHQILSAKYGLFSSQIPLILAETASIFTELLVFNKLLHTIRDPIEKLALYCRKIESIISTVFRQTAMYRFEHLIHTHIRSHGELSPQDFSNYWLQTQEEMFQGSITLTKDYGIWWAYINHFLQTPGYVYSYAFGQLLVHSLYQQYLKDKKSFVNKYIEILSKSGTEYPYNLLKSFGFDIKNQTFWQQGINQIANMIDKIKDLSKEVI